jgi:hypothetical protein
MVRLGWGNRGASLACGKCFVVSKSNRESVALALAISRGCKNICKKIRRFGDAWSEFQGLEKPLGGAIWDSAVAQKGAAPTHIASLEKDIHHA